MSWSMRESSNQLLMSSVRSNKTLGSVGVAMEDKTDYVEPEDGVFATPAPKGIPRYDVAELFYYCKRQNKKPKDLTEKERKMFELPNE
ncbi:hypothetical protein [Bacillus albus]|uniref:hypothetical protein n=1 Tax=Bacillus albus TaxID=2026189 RepID=UPI0018A1395C|nr:hypothetical protein [Bacillus albus]MBF7155067.1 hypothetical protein [Bacillus albus]